MVTRADGSSEEDGRVARPAAGHRGSALRLVQAERRALVVGAVGDAADLRHRLDVVGLAAQLGDPEHGRVDVRVCKWIRGWVGRVCLAATAPAAPLVITWWSSPIGLVSQPNTPA